MAAEELAHGKSPDALRMAQIIANVQQREISFLTDLLSAAEQLSGFTATRCTNLTEHVRDSRATAAGNPGLAGGRTQGVPHDDLQCVQPARPVVGGSTETGARDRQAAGLPGSGSCRTVAANPQSRGGGPGAHRAAQLCLQRSGRSEFCCGACGIL